MIPPSVVEQIKRLLAEGHLSQRKIAKMTGVSRGTVGAIASGKRRDLSTSRARREDELEAPSGPPRRCPQCGARVYLPCRLCHVRRLMAESRLPRRPDRPDGPLELELTDRHRARYEQVRARRARANRFAAKRHAIRAREGE